MQIIHVNLTQESPKLVDAGKALDMTYSVKWEPTNVTFAHRFDVYLDYPFFEHQVITRFDSAIKGTFCTLVHMNFGCHIFPMSPLPLTMFVYISCQRTCCVSYRVLIISSDHKYCSRLQIHWFSIFNSFMMVIFLSGLVSMILMRTLRNDYAKYARDDEDLETLVITYLHK
jgi:hypothetical protein